MLSKPDGSIGSFNGSSPSYKINNKANEKIQYSQQQTMPGSLVLGHHSWRGALVLSWSSGKEYSREYLSQTVHSSRCRAAYGCSSLSRSVLYPTQHIPVSYPLLSYRPGPLKSALLDSMATVYTALYCWKILK